MTAITDPSDLVRLEIGDTDTDNALFTDDEIAVYVTNRQQVTTAGTVTNITLAAADLCDVLSTRFARGFKFATDGQSFDPGERSAFYASRAKDLRARSGGGSAPLVSPTNTAVGDNLFNFGGTIV